jgi:hypothetical protein
MAEKLKEAPSKGAGGSWLYGIILMAAGAFVIVLGVLDLLNMNFIHNYLLSEVPGGAEIAALLPTVGVTNFVIGIFAIIGGYGLIIDQEWGWGISMLILVYTTAQAMVYMITNLISLSLNPSLIIASAVFWISLVTTIVAILGIVYLGLTKYKYA